MTPNFVDNRLPAPEIMNVGVEAAVDVASVGESRVGIILEVISFNFISLIVARALREIRHYQKGGELLIPLQPFQRLVREIMGDHNPGLSISKEALGALQSITETVMVQFFEMSYDHPWFTA